MPRSSLKTLLIATSLCTLALGPAFADLDASFREGAPKDRFTFSNSGNCTIEAATVKLDLSGSKSGLIFDITSQGEGVEVFQPFDLTSGEGSLLEIPEVRDGDNQIVLKINELEAGQNISFTIDVDDTVGTREITVSGEEISGANLTFTQAGKMASSVFGANAQTSIKLEACKL